ncbi:MAG: hypothetical protein HND42_08955 [Armatimonadetes bacterium]|nr:hypothetical protein [Armatimonadota bacterium]
MLQNVPASASDEEVPYLKAQHVQWNEVRLDDLPTMWAAPGEVNALRVRRGDLLVCEGGEVGRACVVDKDAPAQTIIQNALHLVRGKSGQDTRYLAYLLRHAATNEWFDVLCNRSTIAHFTVEKFGDLWAWMPPAVPQQRAIADYLDRETARVDALIAAKERVLGLLAHKRRALITRAVTRGLDPRAPLRDSGIPWLGEIPAHWTTPPVYARFEVQLGKMLDEKKIKATHLAPYLRNADVQWGAINTADLPEMDFDDEDRRRYSLREGDVLVCEGGEVGRSAIWDGSRPECYYQKALHRLRPVTKNDEPKFLVHVMYALVESGQFALQASAATIQHLPAEKLRVVRYPAPPREEQQAIVASIEEGTKELNAVSAATERTIALLKERRSALIAAAVTGQIDVGGAA